MRIITTANPQSNGFGIIQPDAGTSPTADQPNDTLTLTSSDASLVITGNSATDTIDIGLSAGSVANIVLTNVTCNSVVAVGDWVRMDGTGTAQQALADTAANGNVLGLVESKSAATICNIRVLGVTGALFGGLDVTQQYVLSASTLGGMVTADSPPTGSGNIIIILGQPFSTTRFFVNLGARYVRA